MTNDDEHMAPRPGAAWTERFDRPVRTVEAADELDGLTDAVSSVADRLSGSPLGPVLDGGWLGHSLHPLLTDLPIGCWTSAALVDLVGGHSGRIVARRLIGMGVLAALPTAASGLVEFATIGRDDVPSRRVAAVHALTNSAALTFYARSWQVRRRGHHVRGIAWSAAAATLASAAGHLGGHLVLVRGIGRGHRGAPVVEESASTAGDGAVRGDPRAVVGLAAAAEVLGVTPLNIERMMEQALLVPVVSDPPTFWRADLEAIRVMGS